MNIAVLTSLYPSPPRPREGIFAERRWIGMHARGHGVRVVHPVPRVPPLLRGERADFRHMPTEEHRGGIEVHRPRYAHLPLSPLSNARRFARTGVAVVLRDERTDVAVLDYAWPAAAAAEALGRAGLPVVVNGRGSDVLLVREHPALRAALAAGLRTAGRWCAVSRDLVDAMDELAGAPGRGALAPNGVDLELFAPAPAGPARQRIGLDPEAVVVLVVGHLIERKDPLLAARSFARSAPPEAVLVFVGRGPLRGALEDEVRALGLEGRARLVGELAPEELREWYAASDAVLLTSSREGRPNVVLEALASGRPVVATRAGGTAELLEGLDGLLVDARTPEAVGAALARVLAAPPPPETLRAHVEPFTWERGLDALERCLAEAVSAGRGAA
jgi:glycosyltransferase involved in cell wall biosynthesis